MLGKWWRTEQLGSFGNCERAQRSENERTESMLVTIEGYGLSDASFGFSILGFGYAIGYERLGVRGTSE